MAAEKREGSAPELPSSGWDRLRLLRRYAFGQALKVDLQDPEEQLRPLHNALNSWAKDTLLATVAGVVFGGIYQAYQDSQKMLRAGFKPPEDDALKRAIAKEYIGSWRNAAIKGGLRLGGLAAVYFGVSVLTSVYRNKQDFMSHALGSTATTALLGLSLQGPRGAVFGAALGAASGVPLGMLWDSMAPERSRPLLRPLPEGYVPRASGAAAKAAAQVIEDRRGKPRDDAARAMEAAIAQLEARLPSEQQRRWRGDE